MEIAMPAQPKPSITEESASPPAAAEQDAAAVYSTDPPDITIPPPPAGFNPVDLEDYRRSRPKKAQYAAFPDAILELRASTTYTGLLGTVVPSAAALAKSLDTARQWTALRIALEAFLVYAKSLEAVTWKTGLDDLAKVDAVYQAVAAQNPQALASLPALGRLLEVPKGIATRAAAKRVRNAKVKKAPQG
jgi:hypothetical protein